VAILARLQSKVTYGKSEKARLVAVAVAVFAVTKEPQVTALFPVRLFIVHPPELLAELVGQTNLVVRSFMIMPLAVIWIELD